MWRGLQAISNYFDWFLLLDQGYLVLRVHIVLHKLGMNIYNRVGIIRFLGAEGEHLDCRDQFGSHLRTVNRQP